ncbi:uncharacterized protein LOC113375265 [Ctenocephalides felis]|uniref:uncharacterized protein LOC113375263 n=1 Tax=Ctenocephalides felis TaxID=7515 RepID=UPI000E6E564D|nr:uncharacterized protein LOC113375263 [Ctenocephalides felis]XP_026470992.1 uncharacterized protein LOC113375265 [Ctenocephalides felis]
MFTKVIVIVVLCMATVNCFDVCANNDDKCVENKIKEYVDNADQEGSIPLFGGLSIDKVRGVEPLPSSNDESLVGRVQRYMQSHELKFQVPEEKKGRSLTEESRSSKLKKIVLPLLLGLKLKTAVILPIVLTAIALISLKGLGAGVLALLFAGATAFKDLLAAKAHSGHVTYISAPEPHLADWSRSGTDLGQGAYQTIV